MVLTSTTTANCNNDRLFEVNYATSLLEHTMALRAFALAVALAASRATADATTTADASAPAMTPPPQAVAAFRAAYNVTDEASTAALLDRATRGADTGDACAMDTLGDMHMYGVVGASADNEAAVASWRRADALAADEDALSDETRECVSRAQLKLGLAYARGMGVITDKTRAAKYYARAADSGSIDALVNLGDVYEVGAGVKVDHGRSFKYFKRAADAGNAFAAFRVALFYKSGRGVASNLAAFARYLKKAASADLPRAQTALGLILFLGPDAVDPALRVSGGMERDAAEGWRLLRAAAAAGDAVAQFRVGSTLYSGEESIGVASDPAEGLRILEQAANAGHAEAMLNLGVALSIDVKHPIVANLTAARQWLLRANSSGSEMAQGALQELDTLYPLAESGFPSDEHLKAAAPTAKPAGDAAAAHGSEL